MWDEMWSYVDSGAAELQAAPCSRGKHSATLLGGYVYVLGGRGAGGSVPLRDFWRYCLSSGVWERIEARGEPPPALQEHSASAHEERLYVFGGEAGALSNETPLWIYDTETLEWRKLPGQPTYSTLRRRNTKDTRAANVGPRGRRGHSAHTLKDCLLIYGGYMDLRGSTNELWAFHYGKTSRELFTWRAPAPALRRGHRPAALRAAVHRARLYVHGGHCDLRHCADLWHYDTVSRVWTQVRTPPRLSPSARSGHAGLRAGAHLYIFGGEADGHCTNELWRFHFESETWEQIIQTSKWPSARVDGSALLVPWARGGAEGAGGGAAGGARGAGRGEAGGLLREIGKLSGVSLRRGARCSYSVLAAERDSTESLVRHEAALAKSHSAHHLPARRAPPAPPADGDGGGGGGAGEEEDEAEPGPRRLPKSASVRFAAPRDEELSTSDYASAEAVSRLSGSLGFSNPHYEGAVELRELSPRRPSLQVLVLGGREPPHRALLRAPLSMWAYRLL
ncbi:leucine-zipper-like transcriptional regulator 1 [Achroia grisella]|uniref:leucine-zipper-like transcriptional regulator 1 n=1 Tax=Achroia grisella TaxID=688607 RepID=UPI0027D27B43|nr:leucine-zipper-like transcriptional regulator 1 [Achroia grisella]